MADLGGAASVFGGKLVDELLGVHGYEHAPCR